MAKLSDNEITKITEILNDLRERFARIEERLGNKIEDLDKRVTKLEKNQAWVVMAVLVTVITALLKLVIK